MSLFQGLSLIGQSEDRLITDAGWRVIMALARLPGNGAHSLCEVLPDDDDYKWLSAWARQSSSWRADDPRVRLTRGWHPWLKGEDGYRAVTFLGLDRVLSG